MNTPTDFIVVAGRGYFRPVRDTHLDEAVTAIERAIAHAREQGILQLLVDTRGLTGFEAPNTFERYQLMTRWVQAADGKVQVAMILRPEIIDPQRFGLRVAENRGFVTQPFFTDEDAIAWLDSMRE